MSQDNSKSNDWKGLGDLIAIAADRLTTPVRDVHHAITDRWSSLAGPLSEPARMTSRAVTAPIYESIRLTGVGVGRAIRFVASTQAGSDALQPLWGSKRGSGVQAFFNGLWGDELDRQQSTLGIEFSLRSTSGDIISPCRTALTEAFPGTSGRIVVLLHGLGDTEHAWQSKNQETALPQALAERSFTPLLIRYNTGLELTRNANLLSDLLDELVQAWPVPVEDVSLVGHSMGGLVARAALLDAGAESAWTRKTGHVVTLGSPHLGAPLERGVGLAANGLRRTPESAPISKFLDQRSAGIKDLRFGSIDDTNEQSNVEFHHIAGAITTAPNHIIGRLIGDLIVPVASATGVGKNRTVASEDLRVMGGRNHRALLHDPVIHDEILEWFDANPS